MNAIRIEDEVGSCDKHCKGVEVPMEEEVVALNAMREIRNEAKVLKGRIESLRKRTDHKAGEELVATEKELERLKMEWEEWERKRERAARERMILLGHEEPDALDREGR